jgi:hypothetical protein
MAPGLRRIGDEAWLAELQEEALEPERPIRDARFAELEVHDSAARVYRLG